jgi:hypothetical protein
VARNAPAASGKRYAWTIVPLEASLPDQQAVAALLDRHNEEMRARHLAEQRAAPSPPPMPSPYVGVAACGACHAEPARQWRESGHARAMAALARKKQDATPECLRCHVTAYDDPYGFRMAGKGALSLENVQCEACHGFGREHRGRDGKIRGQVPETVCRRCHTTENSPTFQYEPYLQRLGPHAERYFARGRGPQTPPRR